MTKDIIDELYKVIQSRKGEDASTSWTAQLLEMGTETISDKVMEEARETVDEAIAGDNSKLTAESADLLYHLLVLWADRGITPDDVHKELQNRMGTSGIAEKVSRA